MVANREAAVTPARPRHRCPHRVAPEAKAGHILLPGILDAILRDLDVAHPEFFALIERRRAAQGEQQHCGNAGLLRPETARDRDRSWLPSTQLGQAPGGSAASYCSISSATAQGFHGVEIR
jgi:hypothetical protein